MVDFYRNKLADNYKLALSGLFSSPTAAVYDIVRIPHWAFVDDVWLDITTACTAGCVIIIGWKGNQATAVPGGFMSNSIAKPQEIGLKRAQKDDLISFPGMYFNAGSGTITITLTGTFTAGVFQVFAGYSVIH